MRARRMLVWIPVCGLWLAGCASVPEDPVAPTTASVGRTPQEFLAQVEARRARETAQAAAAGPVAAANNQPSKPHPNTLQMTESEIIQAMTTEPVGETAPIEVAAAPAGQLPPESQVVQATAIEAATDLEPPAAAESHVARQPPAAPPVTAEPVSQPAPGQLFVNKPLVLAKEQVLAAPAQQPLPVAPSLPAASPTVPPIKPLPKARQAAESLAEPSPVDQPPAATRATARAEKTAGTAGSQPFRLPAFDSQQVAAQPSARPLPPAPVADPPAFQRAAEPATTAPREFAAGPLSQSQPAADPFAARSHPQSRPAGESNSFAARSQPRPNVGSNPFAERPQASRPSRSTGPMPMAPASWSWTWQTMQQRQRPVCLGCAGGHAH